MPAADTLKRILVRDIQAFGREIELFPDESILWAVLPGVSNSAANLALHVAGNLQHFVGHVLGGSGYVRDREAEFSRRSGSRQELREQLVHAEEAIESVLPGIDAAALSAPYPAAPGGVVLSTETCLLQLAAHLAFHLGQAGILRRALTGSSATSGALALKELLD